jgi:pheromone shutdown protein TraB
MMITLIGTGHIFNISEQVSFIIKNIWPDAVLVELYFPRFLAMTDPGTGPDNVRKEYGKTAKDQERMASEHGVPPGADMMTAVNTGRTLGSDVLFIDKDPEETLERLRSETPFAERVRYRLFRLRGRMSGKDPEEGMLEDHIEGDETAMLTLKQKFPTFARIIVDERDEHMASKISEASERYGNIVAVVGDGHIAGISRRLEGKPVKKIRLRELMNKERMDEIRSELWTHRSGEYES